MLKEITLESPVTDIPLIGESKAELLSNLGIYTVRDILFHIPFKYRDTSNVITISQLKEIREGTIIAKVEKIGNVYTRSRKILTTAKVSDSTGKLNIVWFNQTYIAKNIKEGETYLFEGKMSKKSNDFVAPTYEISLGNLEDQNHIGKIIPYYNETAGITSRWLRGRMKYLQQLIPKIFTYDLPKEILLENNLLSLTEAVTSVHYPNSISEIEKGRERLAFDEMLKIGIKTEEKVLDTQKRKAPIILLNELKLSKFISSLSYTLTHDQEKSLNEILIDLQNEVPMNRLLNGDVGSGKTVVGAGAIYMAYINGYSSILLAPTTILATQHYNTFKEIFKDFDIDIQLGISGKKIEHKDEPQLIIGTHAVLFDKEKVHNLGLLIIDEQHRFGVKQREKLTFSRQDGLFPHYLMMSATPIPHTLTNIIFGDMNVSFIREMPPLRIPIISHFVPYSKRDSCFKWVKDKIIDSEYKEQAFIIFPLIEESEKLDVKAAKKEYENLSQNQLQGLNIALLHGQMKQKEKESILSDFRNGKYNVLISTSVVEVGIDIPTATIMIIEDSQRFGLAQLHQFRGRVGRGDKQSYCFVLSGEKVEQESSTRLKYFASHSSGFDVAQYDLEKRGPGEVYGIKQSGIPNLKVASITDIELLIKTRKVAHTLLENNLITEALTSQLFS